MFEEALRELEKASRKLPKDAVISDHLGDVYYSLNMFNEAKIQWEKSLELAPEKEEIKQKIKRLKKIAAKTQ